MAKKKPPRPCRQRGVCKHWNECPYGHDERLCLTGKTTAEGQLPIEVD